jgi:predicted NBD/HSP70 family sugar kinase
MNSNMALKRNSREQSHNRRKILKKVWENETISRAELAKQLHLSPATVSSNVAELVRMNYIRLGKEGDSSGGRKPIMLEINEDSLAAVGITVMKESVLSSLVNLKGEVIDSRLDKYTLPISKESILSTILFSIKKILEIWNNNQKICGIGIGMHGVVDYSSGISIFAPYFSWHYVNIKTLVEEEFHIPVLVDNDARVMVLAEKWFGKYRSLRNFIFLSLDEGVGGGIMVDGKLFRGSGYAAGEIGHIHVKENGSKCICGNYGCLETVAAIPRIVGEIVDQIRLGYPSYITDIIGDKPLNLIDFDIVLEAVEKGDDLCKKVLSKVGMYIGVASADIINFFNPEAIVIGGKLSLAWDYFKEDVRETVIRQSMHECNKNVKILRSSFVGCRGDIGAAALVVDKILEENFLQSLNK